MPKRHRVRARPRRPLETRRIDTDERSAASRPGRARGAPPALGAPRAVGQPSAGLERAATWERTYVLRDFRKLGVVVALMLVLLGLSGIAVGTLLR